MAAKKPAAKNKPGATRATAQPAAMPAAPHGAPKATAVFVKKGLVGK